MSATWSDAPAPQVPTMPAASAQPRLVDVLPLVLQRRAWSVRLVHGDIESCVDADVLEQVGNVARRSPGLLFTEGSSDETTWVFDDASRPAVIAVQTVAVALGPSWWRLETRFGGAGR